MGVDRPYSEKTWHQMDDLLHKIKNRAFEIKDAEICRDADAAVALLQNLSFDLEVERSK